MSLKDNAYSHCVPVCVCVCVIFRTCKCCSPVDGEWASVDVSCGEVTRTAFFYIIRECKCQACNGAYILNELVVI